MFTTRKDLVSAIVEALRLDRTAVSDALGSVECPYEQIDAEKLLELKKSVWDIVTYGAAWPF